MRTLLFLALTLLLLAAPAGEALAPDLFPVALRGSEPGYTLGYGDAYERWDRALKQQRWDEALAWADEFLMSVSGGGVYAQDALTMRRVALARSRGTAGPARWQDRPPRWRVERVLARRPGWSFVSIALAAVAALLTLVSLAVRLRRRPLEPVGYQGPIGPRPGTAKLLEDEDDATGGGRGDPSSRS